MSKKWMNILNQAGDENIGASLVRLALMARSVHQYEVTNTCRQATSAANITLCANNDPVDSAPADESDCANKEKEVAT